MKDKILSKYFLILLVVMASIACLFLFRPFLIEIIISAVLVSVFYSPYLRLSSFLRGRRGIAALLMCLFLLIVIILPISGLIIFTGKKAIVAYSETVSFIESSSKNLKDSFLNNYSFIDLEDESVKDVVLGITKILSDWLAKGATILIKETTGFFVSLFLILLTMFFFFIDGQKMLDKLKLWSPLPSKYDVEIFKKFREVSYTAMISVFVASGVQGLIAVVGFLIVGIPAFYPGLLIAFLALIPYVGAMFVYVPIGIYLILVGEIGKGVFVLIWGSFVVGNADNVIRAYLLKGRSRINPIFVIFSLIGGMTLFGFWGLVLGPLILSLVATILHIYELEYSNNLEK